VDTQNTLERVNKMQVSDILFENGKFWVLKDKHQGSVTFTVMQNVGTHSESCDDVTYPDVSLAIARCNYLAKAA
jgi:hypothetical protein